MTDELARHLESRTGVPITDTQQLDGRTRAFFQHSGDGSSLSCSVMGVDAPAIERLCIYIKSLAVDYNVTPASGR